MVFDLSREANRIYACWNGRYFDYNEEFPKNQIAIYGERGNGKTSVVQEYIRRHKNKTRYFSFAGLDNAHALKAFCNTLELSNPALASWDEVGQMFQKRYHNRALLMILDDMEFFEGRREFWDTCYKYMAVDRIVVAEIIRFERAEYVLDDLEVSVFIGHRTLSDYCKMLPTYSKQDIVRLFALSGGILPILRELDENASLDENMRTLFRFNSAFSRFLPEWLGEYFRSPESYYPILLSMANGHHRLSEIARDVGFPNNKCQTYLHALIKARLVEKDMPLDSKQATYHLTNSYIAAWCLCAYGKRSNQISDSDVLVSETKQLLDERLALPAFHRCCRRYLDFHMRDYLIQFRYPNQSELRQDVAFRFKDGYRLKLNYCVLKKENSLIAVFPDTLDARYTKEDVRHIMAAGNRLDTIYGTDIVLFSLHRFSDWCVHEVSVNERLHLVALERLKC